VIRAAVPNLYSECHMMSDFLDENLLNKEDGFVTSQLQVALVYLLTNDWKQFFNVEYKLKSNTNL
jgi:hypothetical protein